MNRKEIIEWLREYGVQDWNINDNLTVDVDGDVWLGVEGLTSIPVQFGKVSGSFSCRNNKLTSLKGCPTSVGGNFLCDNNQLTSLEHCPKSVGSHILCDPNLYKDPRYLRHLLKQKVLG